MCLLLLIFFLVFEEEEVITETEVEAAEFACNYKSGEYKDPFLQELVATGDDLHARGPRS